MLDLLVSPPGFEPGLPRPQRGVLTTIRWRRYHVLANLHASYVGFDKVRQEYIRNTFSPKIVSTALSIFSPRVCMVSDIMKDAPRHASPVGASLDDMSFVDSLLKKLCETETSTFRKSKNLFCKVIRRLVLKVVRFSVFLFFWAIYPDSPRKWVNSVPELNLYYVTFHCVLCYWCESPDSQNERVIHCFYSL